VNVLGAVLSLAKAVLGLVPLIGAYIFGKRSARLGAAEDQLDDASAAADVRRRVRRSGSALERLRERWSRK